MRIYRFLQLYIYWGCPERA